ncbi:MAG TPA: hypothetical protein VER55_12280 [Ardenticatenaceae bacterium]|nr:hypothetical protein [Ardenticatenaceae bacterium]
MRYAYDAEGRRVTATVNGVTTTYVGGIYERQGNSTRKHYYFGGQLVAVRQHGVLSYLLADHLGSTSMTLDSTGTAVTAMTSYVTTGSSAA